MTEEEHQIRLIQWSKTRPDVEPFLFHPANGGHRSIRTAVRLKASGVKPGVSDLMLAYPAHGYHGLWIELKRIGKSSISKEQKDWVNRMISVGYAAFFCFGWEDARDTILNYLNG